ncbi:MAG: hypothetical protein KAR19_06865 [Bacteroidales bacterium]|nr:hypothetical protein [Bacteroidales bacterium]
MRTLLFSISVFILITPSTTAQDLEKILADHYKAAAQEKMQKVETIITTGKNIYSMAGIESSFTLFQSRPNNIRVQGDFQGSKVIQTYNGQTGWMYAPMMGISEPQEMKGNELETLMSQTEFESPLWNYMEKGNTLELAGKSDDGSADHIKLTTGNGDVRHLFIDRNSHLITSLKTSQIMGGSETEIEVIMKDYKRIKGIPVAHHIITKMNGQVVTTIQIEEVEFNKKIDQTLFGKPAVE